MSSSSHSRAISLEKREIAFLAVSALVLAILLLGYVQPRSGIASSETQFTDPSESGLAIVPASCPSSPHNTGECTASCTPQYFCTGSNGNLRYFRSSTCIESYIETCLNGCYNGQCLAAEGMNFVPSSATRANGKTFTASGHLQLSPAVVRTGDATRIFWNVGGVQSCAVSGSNGDQWTGSTSGPNGRTTGVISEQIVYTLTCVGLPGADPAQITEHAVVNVIPVFHGS